MNLLLLLIINLAGIDVALVGTASLMEVLWVAVNLAGAYYSLTNWRDALASLRAATDPPVDRVAVVIAEMSVFIQKYITLIQCGFAFLGVVAWFTPPPNGDNTGRVVIVLGLVFLATVLAYKSYRVRRYRLRAMRTLEEEHEWTTQRA